MQLHETGREGGIRYSRGLAYKGGIQHESEMFHREDKGHLD